VDVILYNTLMGVCVGLGALLVAGLLRDVYEHGDAYLARWQRGYGAAFLTLGVPLTVLAGAMTLTWPLHVNPPVNIAFGEPSLLIGVLLLVAGTLLLRFRQIDLELRPLTYVVSALGVMLLVIASAILSYGLIGDAPAAEPITGNWTGWENTTFGVAYLVAGVGCASVPWMERRWIYSIVLWSLRLSGAFFLLFALLNYRTHIGLLINLERGTDHSW
jgi:uncharacterized membrane protein